MNTHIRACTHTHTHMHRKDSKQGDRGIMKSPTYVLPESE